MSERHRKVEAERAFLGPPAGQNAGRVGQAKRRTGPRARARRGSGHRHLGGVVALELGADRVEDSA